jgi:hypothetical protein
MTGFVFGLATTTILAVIVFALLRVRGKRIRSTDPDPRIVSTTVSIESSLAAGIEAARTALFGIGATQVRVDGTTITANTGPGLRTWGQRIQIDVVELAPRASRIEISTWPSRDLQTLDTHAGGRKIIRRVTSELRQAYPNLALEA